MYVSLLYYCDDNIIVFLDSNVSLDSILELVVGLNK